MLSETEFEKRRLAMISELETEIQRVKAGQSNRNLDHLELALKELKESVDPQITRFHYPYFIVDSWDYDDPLGGELMQIAYEFKKMRKR